MGELAKRDESDQGRKEGRKEGMRGKGEKMTEKKRWKNEEER